MQSTLSPIARSRELMYLVRSREIGARIRDQSGAMMDAREVLSLWVCWQVGVGDCVVGVGMCRRRGHRLRRRERRSWGESRQSTSKLSVRVWRQNGVEQVGFWIILRGTCLDPRHESSGNT